MTTKTYTVLEMDAVAPDGETSVSLKFTRDDDGSVEITMSGKFKTVELTTVDAKILSGFLNNGLLYNPNVLRGGDA